MTASAGPSATRTEGTCARQPARRQVAHDDAGDRREPERPTSGRTPSVPGRMMISTPQKPTRIAVIRRQPILFAKDQGRAKRHGSGSACRMADRLASGMCISAVRNRIVAATSARVRRADDSRRSRRVSRRRSPPSARPRPPAAPRSAPAQADGLEQRQGLGHRLHEGVVEREGGHRDVM